MASMDGKDLKPASASMNGSVPFDAGHYSFFDDIGDDGGGLEGGLDDALEGGLEDGVEVPPEEEEFPIEEEVDLALLDTNEAEDLSYAAMFANTLNIGKESLETPQKTQDGLQWSSDPIVQPPSTGQARAGQQRMQQASGDIASPDPSNVPGPTPWAVLGGIPGPQQDAAAGSYQSPGLLQGLQGLDLSQISQAFPQAAFLGELGQAGLPAHALGPGMDAFLQHQQQLLQRAGLAPPSAHHASPLPQPQQRPAVMTMEELEAQLRRKSQQQQQPQQQQQQQQRMPMPGADPSILGSLGQLGPPGQLGQPSQLASPGAVPPQHMQHGPPGFPHPAGPPQRPLDFDKQHLGPPPAMSGVPGHIGSPMGPPPPMPPPDRQHMAMPPLDRQHMPMPPPDRPHMPMPGHPFPPPPPGGRPPHSPQNSGVPPPPGGPAGFPGMPGLPFPGPGMQHMRGHPGPSAWQRPPPHHMMGPRPPPMIPMGHFPPMPPPMMPSPENLRGSDLLRFRCTHGSKLMSSEEIDNILRIQYKFLNSGVPYKEDYYFLACKHKHRKLHEHDLRFFAPDMLRDAAPAGRAPAHEDAAYAKLEGLGKIPFSNIRRPRPLMDLMDKPPAEPSEEAAPEQGDAPKEGRRRLEDEPLLAARIVVEECLNCLLDLDDIDRMWVNSAAPRNDKAELQKRRSDLLEALGRNLRVPRAPQAPKEGSGDGVFMRLMALPKGRGMLTRALRVLYAPPLLAEIVPGAPSVERAPLHIAWALLRNACTLYGCASQVGQRGAQRGASGEADAAGHAAERDIEVTSALAGSATELLKRLDSPAAVCQCMEALVAGDLDLPQDGGHSRADALLPLYIPYEATSERRLWLADLLIALLQRAQELGLSGFSSERTDSEGPASKEGEQWRTLFATFYKLVYEHIASLVEVYKMATAAGVTEAADYAKSIAPVNLIRALLPHTTDAQRDALRSSLSEIQ